MPRCADEVPFLARLDASWIANVQLAWDAFNYDWRRNVVGFNRDRQRSLWREWRLDQVPMWQVVTLVLLLVGAWSGLVVGWLMYKRRHQERALVLWDDLNRRLARAGLPGIRTRAARLATRAAVALAAVRHRVRRDR